MSDPTQTLTTLKSKLLEIQHLKNAAALLSWDQEPICRPGEDKPVPSNWPRSRTLGSHQVRRPGDRRPPVASYRSGNGFGEHRRRRA